MAATARRPSLVDKTFMLFLAAGALLLGDRLLNTDGDLGRHLRVGEWILQRRALFYQDPFSYTRPQAPFVPYEWLSEVAVAAAHRIAGLPGVVVLSAILFAASVALVVRFLLRRGVEPLAAYVVGLAAAMLASAHLLARPHLFTLLGTVLVLDVLEPDRSPPLWRVGGLFLLWANLHGGFLVGLLLLAAYAAGDWLELSLAPQDQHWRNALRLHVRALGVAVVACCINPAGPKLFAHVLSYLRNSYLVDMTSEYRPPDFHGLLGRLFLVALLVVAGGLTLRRQRPAWPRLLAILMLLAFALHSQRNIPLFALAALPLWALHMDPAWRQRPLRALERMRETFRREGADPTIGIWSLGAAGVFVLLALVGGRIGPVPVILDHFSAERFPVAAVRWARTAGLRGRIFSEFTWGGYLLYAWPEMPVFIDGQTDFYGEALTRDYVRIASLDPGWRDRLAAWGVDLALLPADAKLAAALATEPGWRSLYHDSTASIFARSPARAVR